MADELTLREALGRLDALSLVAATNERTDRRQETAASMPEACSVCPSIYPLMVAAKTVLRDGREERAAFITGMGATLIHLASILAVHELEAAATE